MLVLVLVRCAGAGALKLTQYGTAGRCRPERSTTG